MDKENNRSAAGLRRSAIAERIRLREEWLVLKGTENNKATNIRNKPNNASKAITRRCLNPLLKNNVERQARIMPKRGKDEANDVLRGTVALVEVGSESKALPLRAALAALGASVVPSWSPLVTHLIWSQGGCRAVRGKARALACSLVSPLWVEACAAGARKLPEVAFPAAARPSDLPSPKTLRRLLKKAEMENIPLADLLSDSKDQDSSDTKMPKLRMSSDTSADQSADTSRDTSHDQSKDKTDIEHRVNTAPRRALPASTSPYQPAKSRRKLFTHKDADPDKTNDEHTDTEQTRPKPATTRDQLTAVKRRELARAERLARRLANLSTNNNVVIHHAKKPRIVLTGMSKSERHKAFNAIKQLNGRIQAKVTSRTTHVLLGSCLEDQPEENNLITPSTMEEFNENDVLTNMNRLFEEKPVNKVTCSVINSLNRTVTTTTDEVNSRSGGKGRTVNALLGAARGCRVLTGQWALDSADAKRWLHHHGYEVAHLKKICQKARMERTALGRSCPDYAYDVFSGMRVHISPDADNKDAAKHLLQLCGAVVHEDSQNGGHAQNDRHGTADFDVSIGLNAGEINSKWVFDSVAAARMRTTRRYVNINVSLDAIEQIS